MYYTDDPIADFDRYEADRERKLNRLPKCAECGHPIQQEDAVKIKNQWYCDDCLEDMRERIDYD